MWLSTFSLHYFACKWCILLTLLCTKIVDVMLNILLALLGTKVVNVAVLTLLALLCPQVLNVALLIFGIALSLIGKCGSPYFDDIALCTACECKLSTCC